MKELSPYGIYKYLWSLDMIQEYSKAKRVFSEITDFTWYEEKHVDIYGLIALIYSNLEEYNTAISYYELSSKKIQTEKEGWMLNFRYQGDCYRWAGNYSKAAERYRMAATTFGLIHGVDMQYLQRDSKNRLKKKETSYRCDDIDYILYYLFFCNERSGAWSTEGFLLEAAAMARAGNKYATKMCNEAGIDPYSDAMK